MDLRFIYSTALHFNTVQDLITALYASLPVNLSSLCNVSLMSLWTYLIPWPVSDDGTGPYDDDGDPD